MGTEAGLCSDLTLNSIGVTKLHAEVTGNIGKGGRVSIHSELKTRLPTDPEKIDKDHQMVLELALSLKGYPPKGEEPEEEETFNIECTVSGKYSPWAEDGAMSVSDAKSCGPILGQQLYVLAKQHVSFVADGMSLNLNIPLNVRFDKTQD